MNQGGGENRPRAEMLKSSRKMRQSRSRISPRLFSLQCRSSNAPRAFFPLGLFSTSASKPANRPRPNSVTLIGCAAGVVCPAPW